MRAEYDAADVDREEQLAALEQRLSRRRNYLTKGSDRGFDEDDEFWVRGLGNWAEEQELPTLEDVRGLVGGLFKEIAPKVTTEDAKKIRELVRTTVIRDDRRLQPRELENVAQTAAEIMKALAPLHKELKKATGRRRAPSRSTSTACSTACSTAASSTRRTPRSSPASTRRSSSPGESSARASCARW